MALRGVRNTDSPWTAVWPLEARIGCTFRPSGPEDLARGLRASDSPARFGSLRSRSRGRTHWRVV